MKVAFAFLFLVLASFKGFSQFETPKRTVNIAPVSDPKGSVAPTSSKSITYPSIFDKKDKLLSGVSLLKPKEEEQKSVMEKEQFASPSKEKTQQMNDQLKAEGRDALVENRDFYYGEFNIYTAKLFIACRDNGAIDGDQVGIWINGERIVPVITLEGGFRKYTFELKLGLNNVQIEALNTGMLYPNTGQFSFIDGNEDLITTQNWNLNTGYKAIVKLRRYENKLEEKK